MTPSIGVSNPHSHLRGPGHCLLGFCLCWYLTSSHQSQMSSVASGLADPFQKVFSLLPHIHQRNHFPWWLQPYKMYCLNTPCSLGCTVHTVSRHEHSINPAHLHQSSWVATYTVNELLVGFWKESSVLSSRSQRSVYKTQ